MPRFRGDDIPPVSAYAHYNEEAQAMWYAENRYDMEHAGEPLDDFYDDDWYDDEDIDDEVEPAEDAHLEAAYEDAVAGPFDD